MTKKASRLCLPILLALLLGACSDKSYVHYLLDPEIVVPEPTLENAEAPLKPSVASPDQVMKVRFNDGKVFTEVDIPLLTSGQRIIIRGGEGASGGAGGAVAPRQQIPIADPGVAPLPPSANDAAHKTLRDAYLAKGLRENTAAPDASLTKTREAMRAAIDSGNHVLALKHVENVLARYPSHPEFMRAKGTILLLMGERDQAMSQYEAAQQIEFDPAVERKLRELQSGP